MPTNYFTDSQYDINDDASYYKLSPLLNVLLTGSSIKAFLKVLGFFILLYSIVFIANYFDESLIIKDDGIGFLEDYANYFLFIAFFFTTFLTKQMVVKFLNIYIPEYQDQNQLVKQIKYLDCVQMDEDYKSKYKKLLETEVDKIFLKDKKYKIIFHTIQSVIFLGFLIFSFILKIDAPPDGNWNFSRSLYSLSFFSNQLKDFILWVLITPSILYLVFRFVRTVIIINKQFDADNRFSINPLAPDRVGGLRQLGQIALVFFYITIVQLLHFFATSLIHDFPPWHYFIYPIYFLFTIFIFFAPIYSVRKAMQMGKNRELKKINDAFLELSSNINYMKDDMALQKLLDFKNLYKEAEKMPVWPFDIETFSKFASVFLIPIIVLIVQLISDSNSILYNPEKLVEFIKSLSNWFK